MKTMTDAKSTDIHVTKCSGRIQHCRFGLHTKYSLSIL